MCTGRHGPLSWRCVSVCVWSKAASEGISRARGLEEVGMGHWHVVRRVFWEKREGQGAWQGVSRAVVVYFNYSWRIIWAVIDPLPMAGEEDISLLLWPAGPGGRHGRGTWEKKGGKFRRTIGRGGGRQARRLYVAIKFNIITLTSRPGTKLVNKQGGTRYIPKEADLRLFVLPACLFCMMAQFTRGREGEACRPDTTSNTTAWLTARPKANSQVLECFKFYDPLSPNLI